ncbi:MAG: gamma-glutamyltransferase family protein [Geminicoccaceae bacterium]|nr:gamma-glutamyltransferase family protein [Geminicoccaceae bacterium]
MERFTTRPVITGTFGVVASTHWIASAAAMRMLELGGNAFDAAVAGGFVLQVVEPHLNGPGGEMPALLWDARSRRVRVLCGQGPAPALATIEAFEALGVEAIPDDGLLPAVVPGAVDAWLLLLREHGTLDLATVLEPAIAYAERGHPLLARCARTIAGRAEWFRAHWPTSAALWLPGGEAPAPGALFRNPALAASFRRLLAEAEARGGGREERIEAARRAWREGFVAEAIDRFCRETEVADVLGGPHRAFLRGSDLASWEASFEEPVSLDLGRFRVCKTGPWGQGPVLLQALAILDGTGIETVDHEGPEFVHLVIEALKLAMADREAYYGDPTFVPVPLDRLLSRAYADERRALLGPAASADFRPGAIPGYARQCALAIEGWERAWATEGPLGAEPTFGALSEQRGRADTCHIAVADRFGNLVSATPSGGWLQSSPAIPELGFCLGTRGQMFRLERERPDALAPGKRPRTTLSPTLVFADGEPYLACGTPGGDQQDQWQLVFLLRHLFHELDLQAAIDAPLFFGEHWPLSFFPRRARPRSVRIEDRFPYSALEELARRGHRLTIEEGWSIGRLTAVARRGELLFAAATPRHMQAYAVGR